MTGAMPRPATGADIGASLAWSDPARGLQAELRARGLLTHEDGGFRERGFAGSFAWDPDPASERGLSFNLTQTVGAGASGGMDALLRPETVGVPGAADDDDNELRRRRLAAKLGYGLGVFDDRWTATPSVGFGLSEADREVIVGWRVAETQGAGLVFALDVEGARRESVAGDVGAEQRIGVRSRLAAAWRAARARGPRVRARGVADRGGQRQCRARAPHRVEARGALVTVGKH